MGVRRRLTALAALAVLLAGWAALAAAAEGCAPRGKLDPIYCDDNGDGIADPPKDPAKLLNPDPLVFAYVPVEDPAVYGPVFADLREDCAQSDTVRPAGLSRRRRLA